jgi:hypothetical protein
MGSMRQQDQGEEGVGHLSNQPDHEINYYMEGSMRFWNKLKFGERVRLYHRGFWGRKYLRL